MNGSAMRGDLPLPMVATADVARAAAERLVRRDFGGFQHELLLGPEDVSMREATRRIGERVGMGEVPYVELPPEAVAQALLSAGMSDDAARAIVEMQVAINDGRPFGGVRRTPGNTAPTTLDLFLTEALAPEAANGAAR